MSPLYSLIIETSMSTADSHMHQRRDRDAEGTVRYYHWICRGCADWTVLKRKRG